MAFLVALFVSPKALVQGERRTQMSAHGSGVLWLEVTNGCNLNCIHCYSDSYPGSHVRDRLSREDYLAVIADGAALGFSRIQFIGGEPTLNRSLPDFIDAAAQAGYGSLELYTNLRTVPEDVTASLVRHSVRVATSIYAAKAEVHDAVTRQSGSFEATVRTIKRLVSMGVEVDAGFVEGESNRNHFAAVCDMLGGIGVSAVGFDRIRRFGRAQVGVAALSELCGICAGHTACVSHDGQVFPCIMSRHAPLGSLIEESLAQILSSPRSATTREAIRRETAGAANSCTPNTCLPHLPGCNPNTCRPHLPSVSEHQTMR